MAARLLLDDKINIIKTYYSTKNYHEVHRCWPSFSDAPKPTVANIRNVVTKFEATGSVENVTPPGRPVSANTPRMQTAVAESLAKSPQKSTRRLSTELGTSHCTVLRALQQLKYRPFRPRLLHGLLEDDPYQRVEFCEQYQGMVDEDESFQDRIIWSDEANFKLNGHINRHNCVYWDAVNPNIVIEREVNSPGVMAWAGIWSEGVIGPFLMPLATGSLTWPCSTINFGHSWGILWKNNISGICTTVPQPTGPNRSEAGSMKSSPVDGLVAAAKLHGHRGLLI